MMKYLYLSAYPHIFVRMTGLRLAEFDALVDDVRGAFSAAEMARLDQPGRKRGLGGGDHADLSMRDQVLLTVIWLRQYPTEDVLGYFFGLSQSSVSRVLHRVEPLLAADGRGRMRMPDPGRKHRRHLDQLLADLPELMVVIDSFEQKVQRPQNAAERDAWYSGKKKTHTIKSQTAVDEDTGEIADVAESVPGPRPDIKLLAQSGLLARLPTGVGGMGDCGYQGIANLHVLGHSPRKKQRGQPRSSEDIAFNTAFSRRRIIVENTNARLRRYQSLSQIDRNHRQDHTQRVRAVAGLVNRQIRSRLLG